MKLAEISLRNWKGYRKASLQFPECSLPGHVVLVSGANGAGKTSLLEAIVLALYGRQGLDLVGRADQSLRPELSYDKFLERALNAAAQGRDARMAVELVFETAEGEVLSLERVWHFAASGKHRPADEEIHIRRGDELVPAALPVGLPGEEAWREVLGQELLPLNLAPFFIFDGENLARSSRSRLEDQLNSASEIILGAPELRGLAADLRTYARDRKKDLRDASEVSLQDAQDEIAHLELEESRLVAKADRTMHRLGPLRARRDALVKRIGALHGDSYSSFKTLFEEREIQIKMRSADQDELRKALSVDLALALSGKRLIASSRARLEAEALLAQWENGQENNRARFDAFIAYIGDDGGQPLDPTFEGRLEAAWQASWANAPEGAATETRHAHLGDADRLLVLKQLDAVSGLAGDQVSALARRVAELDREIEKIELRIATQRGLDGQAQALADELREAQEDLAKEESDHRIDTEALDAVRLRLSPLRHDIGLRTNHVQAMEPVKRRAALAEGYASALTLWVEEALPQHLDDLTVRVTDAHHAMAHKKLMRSIVVRGDGIELLGSDDRNLLTVDFSAGEGQVLSLSLMAAIAASFPCFPIVMDTPFARLDPEHRRNVLQHFSQIGVQVLLLAHPGEIDRALLDGLGDRFAGQIDVTHEMEATGVGLTRIGQFEARQHGS
ncbi:DNA sulfur modification protein DndD [Bosea sp. BE125]|uniref:AAA family ATPase n=1 Tax=Bosea sp. BE125 TaxID=2817909 RepID=UPI0028622952|nr:AAA family ATPase [Bosea sp. BE125]MDR6875009.1 DNA sulfur modification protein DndD [Bosea sp. BE125]